MSISDRLGEIEVRRAHANSSLNGRHMLVGKDVPEMLAALRAVLDLHKPYDDCGEPLCCRGCDVCGYGWPCDTVRAVKAALGEES